MSHSARHKNKPRQGHEKFRVSLKVSWQDSCFLDNDNNMVLSPDEDTSNVCGECR